MEACPKCSNDIHLTDTNITVHAAQPWRKVQAKICTDCNFVELIHN